MVSLHRNWRHEFSHSVRAELKKFETPDTIISVYQLLEDWISISIAITISYSLNDFQRGGIWKQVIYYVTYFAAILVIGARMRALSYILHQGSHGMLSKNKLINYLLSTFFSGYLIGYSWEAYLANHVRAHHAKLGTMEDPDFVPIKDALYSRHRTQFLPTWYILKHIIYWPPAMLEYFDSLLHQRIFSHLESSKERILRISFYTLLGAGIHYAKLHEVFLWYWVVPFFTTAIWVGNFAELLEHYPLMEGVPKVEFAMSRNYRLHPLENFILCGHWEGYHLLHHLFPRIPNQYFPIVHRILMDADPFYKYVNSRISSGFINNWKEILLLSDSDGASLRAYCRDIHGFLYKPVMAELLKN